MTTLELTVSRFLEHKRAVGRKYESEKAELRLLMRFAEEHGASRLEELTPVLLDDFLASRSRPRPRGFNHLLGVVRRLLDWAVAHELLKASPLQTRPRRETATRIPFLFDTARVRRLLDAAAALPDAHKPPNAERPIARSSRSATGLDCASVRQARCVSVTSTAPAACSS